MITSVADTSFVVALGNLADKWHSACNKAKRGEDTIALPQSVLAEVGYMFNRELDNRAMASFLRGLNETKFRVIPLETEDLLRTADILDQYADSRLDFVHATIVAVAERLGITRILTLDQRDFHIVRPRHAPHFERLPSAQ
jgi:predicted nucleic acid-binding protein